MRPKTYVILERAVEEGVARGWNRAHKHVDSPTEDVIRVEIEQCVMAAICEMFTFDETE